MVNTATRDEYVARYGGKAGLHKLLRDTGKFDKHLLPTVYIRSDQDPEGSLVSADWDFEKRNILRASHPGDLFGLVDVLRTETEVSGLGLILEFMDSMRRHAKSPEVMSYGISEDRSYDGNITIMLQPELIASRGEGYTDHPLSCLNPLWFRGSVAEHPNDEGRYHVSLASGPPHVLQSRGMLITKDDLAEDEALRRRGGWGGSSQEMIISGQAISLYDRVVEELSYKGFSVHMEFGIEDFQSEQPNIIFHQARIFRPYEEPAFRISSPTDSPFTVVGQTAPEGIELAVKRTQDISDMPSLDRPFIWIAGPVAGMRRLPLIPVPKNMKAFMIEKDPIHCTSSLDHNFFRFLQKADVGILGSKRYCREPATRELLNDGDRVRLTANGRSYSLEMLQDA